MSLLPVFLPGKKEKKLELNREPKITLTLCSIMQIQELRNHALLEGQFFPLFWFP
jgi:hypothetical protein